jgi:hypothetical protein
MGITTNCSKFLFYAKSLGVDFNRTLTLGRLNLFVSKKDISEQIRFFQNNSKDIGDVKFKDEYCEPLLEILGSNITESLDYSAYEKPTIVHDLNQPVPLDLKNRFSAIIDGGTIEHVFNFPAAIRNCMEMLEVGGHYIGITPVNNLMGHGFYQYSPELYYRVFSNNNGFEVIKAIICVQLSEGQFSDWYEVVDPKMVKNRVMFTNEHPTYLMVLAKKVNDWEVFLTSPQQSDYQMIWSKSEALGENKPAKGESRIIFLYRKLTPHWIKAALYYIRTKVKRRKATIAGFGTFDPAYYKKVELENKGNNERNNSRRGKRD